MFTDKIEPSKKTHDSCRSVLYKDENDRGYFTVFRGKNEMYIVRSRHQKFQKRTQKIIPNSANQDIRTENNLVQSISGSKKSRITSSPLDLNSIKITTTLESARIFTNSSHKIQSNVEKQCGASSQNVSRISDIEIYAKLNVSKSNSIAADNDCSLSVWSDWSYHSNKVDNRIPVHTVEQNVTHVRRYFDFLPKKLKNILLDGKDKLVNIALVNNFNESFNLEQQCSNSEENILHHKEIDVRPCKYVKRSCEFRLTKSMLESVKVLKQINNEFIAALMVHENFELLLLMDQHAVHERIRYEHLLANYKALDNGSFLTKRLVIPITTEVSTSACNLLSENKPLLRKFGVIFDTIDRTVLRIYGVPKCLARKKSYKSNVKLTCTIQDLLSEIVNNIVNRNGANILPLSIHKAISAEACHGAIKFGDPLTTKKCVELVNELKYTKSPTRCAHGRPSIVPILEFSSLRKKCCTNVKEKKLNFSSLKTVSRTTVQFPFYGTK